MTVEQLEHNRRRNVTSLSLSLALWGPKRPSFPLKPSTAYSHNLLTLGCWPPPPRITIPTHFVPFYFTSINARGPINQSSPSVPHV